MSFLSEVLANKQMEIAESAPIQALGKARGTFLNGMAASGKDKINIVAEVKPRSPAGVFRTEAFDGQLVSTYEEHASAISVLTDEKYFGGSFELLARVSAATTLPTLCKDFVLSRQQIQRARACGAEAVLLIVKILDATSLSELSAQVTQLGMTPVVEVQSFNELAVAEEIDAPAILINNRNLSTLAISLKTTIELAPLVSKRRTVISASGINNYGDIAILKPYVQNFLIGSSLMQAKNLAAKFAELKGPSPCQPALGGTC